jgi:hypothetical protein
MLFCNECGTVLDSKGVCVNCEKPVPSEAGKQLENSGEIEV